MKKNTRLILLAVLTLLMVGLLAVAVSAANVETPGVYTDDEETVPYAGCDSLKQLVADIKKQVIFAEDINTIVINADMTIEESLDMAAVFKNKAVTIQGNGHTLTANAELKLPATATVENLALNLNANLQLTGASNLTFVDTTVVISVAGGITLTGTDKVSFTGGKITMNSGDIRVNSNNAELSFSSMEMEGKGTGKGMVYLPYMKAVTFTNVTVEAFDNLVVYINDGSWDVSGNTGTLTFDNCTVKYFKGSMDSRQYTAGSIWLQTGNRAYQAKVYINGGNYRGNIYSNGAALYISSGTFYSDGGTLFHLGDGDKNSSLYITDGTFISKAVQGALIYYRNYKNSDQNKIPIPAAEADPDRACIRISGGTFEHNATKGDNGMFELNISGNTPVKDDKPWPDGLPLTTPYCMIITGGKFTENGNNLFVVFNNTEGEGSHVIIKGGEFAAKNVFFRSHAPIKLEISGGTFSSVNNNLFHMHNGSWGGKINITGGTFTNEKKYIFNAAGAAITIGTAEGVSAPTFISGNVIFAMSDNDVLSRVTINGGVFNATGNGRIFLINANTIKYEKVNGELVRSKVEEDGVKKGRVTIQGGTFSSEFGAAIEYTTIYNLAQVTITAGDFTACKVPLKMCTESQLTGIGLLTAGCIATNTFHMTTPSEKDGSSVTAVEGTTWYKDVEALWNDLDNSYEDGEITLLADQNYAIDLTGHNFYAVVHVNGKAIDPEKITGATLDGVPTDGTVTMDCSKTVIASSQVTLKDNIVVSFKGVRLAHGQTKLVVTIAGKRFELKVGDAVQTKVNAYRQWHDGAYHSVEEALPEYTFTFEGLVPQCYDTNVTITDEAGTGTEIFNLKAYCETVKVDKPEFTAVADALLVYGEAARQYVENEVVAAPEGFEAPTPGDVSKTEITGVVFQSARLNLADKVSLVFRVELTGNLAEYTVTVGGNPVTPVLVEGTTYDITVDLAASQLTDGITLSVVKGEETATLTYGVANYIVNMQSDTAIANFLKAIWLYGVAAAATV